MVAVARVCLAALIGVLALGCLPPPAQVIVVVDAEPGVLADARYDHVRVQVFARDAPGGSSRAAPTLNLPVRPGAEGGPPLPFRVVLTPTGGDASRTYEVRVTAEDASDDEFVLARAISGYAPRETLVLPILLRSSCVDVLECEAEQTCDESVCVSATVLVEDLVPLEIFRRDAGPGARDGGPDDAALDARVVPQDAGPDARVDTTLDAWRDPAVDAWLDPATDAWTPPSDAGVDAWTADDAGGSRFRPTTVVLTTMGVSTGDFHGASVCADSSGDFYAASEPGRPGVVLSPPERPLTTTAPGATPIQVACGRAGAAVFGGTPSAGVGGSAAMFERGTGWSASEPFESLSIVGTGAELGASVSLTHSGELAVVGAPGGVLRGSVFVYTRAAGAWTEAQVLESADGGGFGSAGRDRFGAHVAASGDGRFIAVGAPFEDGAAGGVSAVEDEDAVDSGVVFVFASPEEDVWGGSLITQVRIKAPLPVADARFGAAVALDARGETLVVGAPSEGGGAVYVYTRIGSAWSHAMTLTASNAGSGDKFGSSVAISDDGMIVVVGAPGEDSTPSGLASTSDEAGTDSGAVYVFDRAFGWAQTFLKYSGLPVGGGLGESVAVAGDGRVVIAGAPLWTDAQGAVFVFR